MIVERMPLRLIVTVDTEEEGLWGGRYRAHGNTTENLRSLPMFQELCDRYEIRPTYLIDGPVLTDLRAVDLLAAWQNDCRCEIGAHCHPWCNPPYEEEINSRNSYLCNLPADLQRRKLRWLTESIEAKLGRRPTSFRAGRYGLDGCGAGILAELGYLVDSSVVPYTDYSSNGGPNFDGAPVEPYWLGEDLRRPVSAGELLEVPVSVGYGRRNFEAAHALRLGAMRSPWRRVHAAGLLDRCGIVRRIKLSPEQATLGDLKRLATLLISRGASCLVLMFHSSSLMAGGSPYVRDRAGLDRFLARLEGFLQVCRRQWHVDAATLSEYALSVASRAKPTNALLEADGQDDRRSRNEDGIQDTQCGIECCR